MRLSLFAALVLAPLALAQDQHIDPSADFHAHSLTITRHVDAAFALATARDGLVQASRDLQVCNSRIAADQDVATAVSVATTGALGTFGTAGDGGAVVTTAAEMTTLLANNTAYIKVITSIQACGGVVSAGIIGCAPTPGSSIAIVNGLSTAVTGEVIMHEFGHNKGLAHRDAPGTPFMHTSTLGNVEVNAAEAAAYHMGGTRTGPNRPVDVAFVIDDTGSMSEEIGGVRQALTRHLGTFPANACTAFRLDTFKDAVTSRAPTTDLTTIGTQVSGLSASGGGDCPEGSVEALTGILPSVRPDRGRVFLATDADPHPGLDLGAAIQQFRADGVRVDVILTGSCSGAGAGRRPGEDDQSRVTPPATDKPPTPRSEPRRVLDASDGPIPLGDDDFEEVLLPFAFPFGGTDHSTVFVNSNGSVSFGEGDTGLSGDVSALLSGPPRIAAFWRDLNPAAGGAVSGETVGDTFKITFDEVRLYNSTATVTFSIVLRSDGTSAVEYGAVASSDFLAGISIGTGIDPGETDLSAGGTIDADDTGGTAYELFNADFDLADATVEYASVESVPPRIYGSIDGFALLARETGGVFAFIPEVNSGGTSGTTRFENVAFNIVQGGLTQAISLVEPAQGPAGGTVGVTLTASGTNFQSGTTLSASGTGVTVSDVVVLSPTRLRATLGLAPGADVGFRDLVATTALGEGVVEEATGAGAFEVVAAPSGPIVVSIQPSEGVQGQALTVRVSGLNTTFGATSVLDLGGGINVTAVRPVSATALDADLTILGGAQIGFRNVSVTTGSEVATEGLTGPFFVSENAEGLIATVAAVSPTSVAPGTEHTLSVTGQNTTFAQGSSAVSLSGSGIEVLSTTVTSATSLTAEIRVDANASLGARDVRVTTGAEVAVLLDALFVTGLAPAAPALLSPADGATDVLPTSDLTWVAVAGATSYDTQVATDAGFSDVVTSESVATTSVEVTLTPSTTYHWRVRARNEFGDSPFTVARSFSTLSNVATEDAPTSFALYPSFPNPSQTEATVRFDVASAEYVRLIVLNVLGQEVARLADAPYAPGRHAARLDVSSLSAGVYLLQIEMGSFRQTHRMTVAR